MARNIEQTISDILSREKKTIAIAESCTGGDVSSLITKIPGSSIYFLGGAVAYSNQAKINILKVSEQIIQEDGAVSRPCVVAMAKNIRSILRTDIGVGITGIAGPTGASGTKPVGSVYIAVTNGEKLVCKLFKFEGSRIEIRQKASTAALRVVKEFLAV